METLPICCVFLVLIMLFYVLKKFPFIFVYCGWGEVTWCKMKLKGRAGFEYNLACLGL